MEERVVRMIRADRNAPSVIAGRIRLEKRLLPPEGNQPSRCEKNRISISPSQKFGMETPIKEITELSVSTIPFWWVADRIPSGIASATAKMIEATPSFSVAGKRCI